MWEWFVIGGLIVFLVFLMVLLFSVRRREEVPRPPTILLKRLFWFVLILSVVGVAVFFGTMFVEVKVGHALIITDPFGKTISDVKTVGHAWYVKMPWHNAVDVYYATDTFEDIVPCFSKDQLEMKIQVLIRWSLDTTQIRELYMSYPMLHYKEKTIQSITEETIRLVTKNYTAIETIELRDIVDLQIQDAIFTALNEEPSLANALTSLEFDLKNIEYPDAYTSSIEAKLVAEQQKKQAEFEKERTIILANATAQKQIIEAEGKAKAIIIEANATAEAIKKVVTSMEGDYATASKLYVTLRELKAIAEANPNMVFILGQNGDGTFFLLPIDKDTSQ